MPGAGNKMQFQKNYFTEENINKGGQGAFSSKFKSYITDGESALKDNIYQTGTQKTRADVMRDIRAGLRQRMQENNEASSEAAGRMMEEHKTLRLRMQEALQKVKDATRQKKQPPKPTSTLIFPMPGTSISLSRTAAKLGHISTLTLSTLPSLHFA